MHNQNQIIIWSLKEEYRNHFPLTFDGFMAKGICISKKYYNVACELDVTYLHYSNFTELRDFIVTRNKQLEFDGKIITLSTGDVVIYICNNIPIACFVETNGYQDVSQFLSDMVHYVEITETLQKRIPVWTASHEEAQLIIEELYKKEDIILSADSLVEVNIL